MFVTPDTRHIALSWREDLAALIPHARAFDYQGQRMLLIPNGHDEAKVCRNVGVPVPAPILTRYDWRGQTPWAVQKTTAALMTESPRAYVLNGLGTGKTRAAIFAADYLMRAGAASPTLITAPLSTLTPVWEQELFRVLPQGRVRVLHGSKEKRLKLLEEDADWFVVNHHGLDVLGEALVARGFGILVIDEIATFRNKGTHLWKALATVVNAPTTKFAWGMTGSPTPQAPTDAWGQARLLTPERVPRTMTRFRDMTMRQVSNFKWIPRPEATDIVRSALQPSVRFSLEDVQELPETVYVDREVKLEPDAAKAYKLMWDKMVMMSQQGQITAVNEGVLQTKLLQVACGYIYTDSKKVFELPAKPRQEALLDLVTSTERKVIVFVPFVHALHGVAAFLRHNKQSVATVHGGTARRARDKIFSDFQNAEEPRVLVAHPQCMAHGLTLTSANTIVWYSPTNSLEIYEQANARIRRPGQTAKTLIAHLIGTPVEKAAYSRLKTRAKLQGLLLEMFRSQEVVY